VVVGLYFRLLFAYDISRYDDEKQSGALLIAVCLLAATGLRGELIQPSPKVKATIHYSVQLADCWTGLAITHGLAP
jgi:hypothetical protein